MIEHDEQVREEAAEATAAGGDLRAKVRDITLKALTQRELDTKEIRNVVKAVGDGILSGSERIDENDLRQHFQQAFSGIDDALSKSAEAAKLATQEAIGRTSEFTDHDLKNALDELAALEDLFVETMRVVASQGTDVTKAIVTDVSSHFKQTGTSVGTEAKAAIEGLQSELSKAGRDVAKGTAQAGQAMGRQLATIASGILSGMSEALDAKTKKP